MVSSFREANALTVALFAFFWVLRGKLNTWGLEYVAWNRRLNFRLIDVKLCRSKRRIVLECVLDRLLHCERFRLGR